MKTAEMSKFISALENAGLKFWSAVTDMSTHFYHNPDQKNLIFFDGSEYLATVRFNRQNEGPGKVFMNYAHLDDIHEVRTSGDPEQIKSILEELGMTVSDDDMKIIVSIVGSERGIKATSGNYNGKDFIYLTEKQLERLSPEEREKYEIEKAEWEEYLKEKEKDIPGPLQVSLGYPGYPPY